MKKKASMFPPILGDTVLYIQNVDVYDDNKEKIGTFDFPKFLAFAKENGFLDLTPDDVEEMYHRNYNFEKGHPLFLDDGDGFWYWDITGCMDDIIHFKK